MTAAPAPPDAVAGAEAARWQVAVRTLCEFTARSGDLDLRYTPAPSALQGIAGHARVAARRGAGWQAEVPLQGHHGPLLVRGRADGFDAARGRLEEIKTHRGSLARQNPGQRALHWAQARIYGWLLCAERGLDRLELALVYLDIDSEQETVFTEVQDAPALHAHFALQCGRYLAWAQAEAAHRDARDAALAALAFPHAGGFRAGQRELAAQVWHAATRGRCLLAQAPTGIGKTVATLFAQLKAAPQAGIDKVLYLAAKTSGRQMALDALVLLTAGGGAAAGTPGGHGLGAGGMATVVGAPVGSNDGSAACTPAPAMPVCAGPSPATVPAPTASGTRPDPAAAATAAAPAPAAPLRVLELVAREKACEHPGSACHGQSCPLALGFFDRLPAARGAALAPGTPLLTQARVRAVALAHGICPYYLSQELARWADVVVGDYHYWFDPAGLLHALAQQQGWRAALLVDEAHNLVERARGMYGARLDPQLLRQARQSVTAARVPRVKKALGAVRRAWLALERAMDGDYAVHAALPAPLAGALTRCAQALSEQLAEQPEQLDAPLLEWYFALLQFNALAEGFDARHALLDSQRLGPGGNGGSAISLRCVVPAPHLAPRWAAAHSATLFSATLQPQRYHADLLGLPPQHAALQVAAPFAAEQLQVRVARHVSTRWAQRAQSVAPIVRLMAAQFGAAPGNYLAFFSSYDYLDQVAEAFAAQHPHIPHWRQERRMGEAAQRDFLARFAEGGQGIGFAVLGGAFAEGVDLPGRRLVGAFVCTLGLPQVNPVNEQIRQRLQALFGRAQGHDYTYLYPGLQKVVQAAGRVIRTPEDRGVVHLIDDRFDRAQVRALLPDWWQVEL
ncbi:DNA excision repair protein ERCC-2 [Oryzisolibacter propanilivorax]|uniref:DNA excision repair protein ERCC-2 n=1 Tax=Oryzisolibacter propanilivorax TaxID=1527607 RepID=A0A1G9QGL3_9BURK|nr:ATP-dependent DNA helicase [Oryzisolibacter propanilivorax]SDM09881.1 DNA excision repair protein ERCC-2 [Oryzisolibacter propanilivorax]